jgi:hypothetical protein
MEYVESKQDPLVDIVRTHNQNTNSTLLQAVRNFKKSFQSETKQIKHIIAQNIKEKWERKWMNGQFPRNLDEKFVDKEQVYRWLKFGDIKGETEPTIVAAQDQAINTNYFRKKILKQLTDNKCRLCKEHEETIDHLISGCPILAKNEYIIRHDRVCTHTLFIMQGTRHRNHRKLVHTQT